MIDCIFQNQTNMSSKMSIYFVVILVVMREPDLISGTRQISDDKLRNVGTTLVSTYETVPECVSIEEASLFKARQAFDLILPFSKNIVMSEKAIKVLVQYFYVATEIIQKMSSGIDQAILLNAYFDTIGGYLNHYLIPVTKFSFYAGEISLRTVKFVINLLEESKHFLNTNGLGWAEPITEFQGFTYKIEPLKISLNDPNCVVNRNEKPLACVALILINDENSGEDIIVSLPKLEIGENGTVTNIRLPYKRKHIFNLRSKTSGYILLNYYVDVTKCYKLQNISQEYFNKKFYKWLSENVVPQLFTGTDFYPALGAVLRILETVKSDNQSILSGNQIKDQINHTVPAQSLGNTDKTLSKITNEVRSFADAQNTTIFTRFFGEQDTSSKAEEDKVKKNIIIRLLVILPIIFIFVIVIAFACHKRKTDKICAELKPDKPFYQKCGWKFSSGNSNQSN